VPAHLFFGGETVGELLEHQVRIHGGDAACQDHEHPFHHSRPRCRPVHNGESLRKFQRCRGSTPPAASRQVSSGPMLLKKSKMERLRNSRERPIFK
jgi:hypothetical protein